MKRIVLQLLCCLLYAACAAQCTIDSSQTTPGLYPLAPPNSQVGVYYNQDFTIVFPAETLGLDIQSVQLDSIEGNIPGLSWVCNSPFPNCTYYPTQSIYGCINISGIPLQSGLYQITIKLIVDIQLIGIQNVSITLPAVVDPGILNNTGFQANPSSGCAPLNVNITSNTPGQVSYHWDFGNGDTSLLENPDSINYDTAGTYIIYREIIPQPGSKFYLMGITVNTIPDAYDDGGFDVADLYIKIKDTSGVNHMTKAIVMNQIANVSYGTDTLFLNNENYTVEVWDDDPLIGAPDDSLGVISFAGWSTSGNATATLAGASGILDVNYTIMTKPINPVIDSVIVYVYGIPPQPVLSYSNDTLSAASLPEVSYQWYNNSQPMINDTLNYIATVAAGSYVLTATSGPGCSSTSLPFVITSLNEALASYALQVYPNPTTGLLHIQSSAQEKCIITITDTEGKVVFKKGSIQLPYEMNLSLFDNGIYFLHTETEEGKCHLPLYIVH